MKYSENKVTYETIFTVSCGVMAASAFGVFYALTRDNAILATASAFYGLAAWGIVNYLYFPKRREALEEASVKAEEAKSNAMNFEFTITPVSK